VAEDRRADRPAAPAEQPAVWLIAVAGWLVPGAAHFLLGQAGRALIFFVALVVMFAVGIACGGRLFPLQVGDPFVMLEAAAEWLLGVPRLVAGLGGYGGGEIVRASYEYGNTFLIVSGLLNALVVLNALDLASPERSRS